MMKYVVIALNQFYTSLTYKFNFFIGIFNTFLSTLISIFVWNAIYSHSNQLIGGMTRIEMLFYIIITNIGSIIFSFENVVRYGGLIRSGKLTTMLIRPYSLLKESFAIFIGQRLFFISIYIIIFVLKIINTDNVKYNSLLFLYFISILIMLNLLINLIGNLGFWLIQVWPLRPLFNAIYMLFGGLYFPLNLLPENIYITIKYNPFSLIGYQFTKMIQGLLSNEEFLCNLVSTWIWIIVFFVLYKNYML